MTSRTSSTHLLVAPSIDPAAAPAIDVGDATPEATQALGLLVPSEGDIPDGLAVPRDRLVAAGFSGVIGATLVVPTSSNPITVAVGLGDARTIDSAALRSAAAAFARAASGHSRLALSLDGSHAAVAPDVAAQAIVEGVLLARYRYDTLRRTPDGTALEALTIIAAPDALDAVRVGVERGRALAAATQLARDLANTPHSHLTASSLADLAATLGPERGLDVVVFDKDALVDLGCGGLLGVNAGSAEPPRMIKLVYRPAGAAPTGHISLVGKGIMYDSGGLALKPGDEVHAHMKNDMSGAAAILAAMSVLAELECSVAVTGFLMCTDNMPSGTALALGDVITMRGGTTVEVINTDAEGRLVMADALVLATEEPTDAIVDVATLTGACMRALGTKVAGVIGNHQGLVDQIRAAADVTDEPVWQLPLETRYRKELDSTVADLRNLTASPNAGAITAGLFLAEFVADRPWAHIDIAGTAQSSGDDGWQTAGCTGFGARLVAQLALDFTPPGA